MCINQLGIALDSYGDGALFLFRGTEMRHYISQSMGNYRHAFDHTTHQSVENAIIKHEETGRWGSRRDPAEHNATKGPQPTIEPNAARKSKKIERTKMTRSQMTETPLLSRSAKRMKRSRSDEDDGEEKPSKKPAPKKSKATLPVRKPRQARKKKRESVHNERNESNK